MSEQDPATLKTRAPDSDRVPRLQCFGSAGPVKWGSRVTEFAEEPLATEATNDYPGSFTLLIGPATEGQWSGLKGKYRNPGTRQLRMEIRRGDHGIIGIPASTNSATKSKRPILPPGDDESVWAGHT